MASAGPVSAWLAALPEVAPARAAELGRPLVTLSYAQSLDGSLTTIRGHGLAISGQKTRRLTHQLRAGHAGILVGIGTILADDPELTARLVGGPHPQSVVLDSSLHLPPGARLMRGDIPPWIFAAADVPEEHAREIEARGARVFRVPRGPQGGVDLTAMLAQLYQMGIVSLMVEGGARVLTSFLKQRLFDAAVITIATCWVGGLKVVEDGLALDGRFPALECPACEMYGRDLVVWGLRREWEGAE